MEKPYGIKIAFEYKGTWKDPKIFVNVDSAEYNEETGILTYRASNVLGFELEGGIKKHLLDEEITDEGMHKLASELIGTQIEVSNGL